MIRSLSAEELRACGSDSSRGFGALDTLHGCLPLVSLDVTVWIEGLIAETRVKQRFANRFGEPLEATYIFPLPPMSAVTGFRMTVGDRVIEGRIDERGQARAEYDRALAAGQTAAITEEERPNVFSLRVGNIPPGATADIEFALVEAVAVDEGEATYRFPLVVKPRYCPGEPLAGADVGSGITADTDQVPDASRISPPISACPAFPIRCSFPLRSRCRSPAGWQARLAARCPLSPKRLLPASGESGFHLTSPSTAIYSSAGGWRMNGCRRPSSGLNPTRAGPKASAAEADPNRWTATAASRWSSFLRSVAMNQRPRATL